MRDAFGIVRDTISKSVPKGIGQIQRMSAVARTGQHPKMALRAKQAQNGMKQVDTPENATRKVTDSINANASAVTRDINSWAKGGYGKFPSQKPFKQYPRRTAPYGKVKDK
jgi:hypothetical protein